MDVHVCSLISNMIYSLDFKPNPSVYITDIYWLSGFCLFVCYYPFGLVIHRKGTGKSWRAVLLHACLYNSMLDYDNLPWTRH